jgi:peptide/nickel transport system permease protein/oligopeptide transport system permease protein
MVIGTVLGLISGFFGKKTDFMIMRLADVVLAFPSLLLAMVTMYTLGASTLNLFIALSIISWAGTARVVRSQTLSLKEEEFIEAANSMGVKKRIIMIRHILPNCLHTLIVLFTLNIPGSILSEASLSFLGVGAQPPDTSWGLMISQGQQYFFQSPWLIIAPGMAILIIVLAFNFLGDGLRDAIDPYSNE